MHSNIFINFFYKLAGKYPTPSNLSYLWNFGIFALVALIIQLITGIILVMHYTPHIDYSFYSVEHIMRDVNYGWLLRYAHANGASMFFIVVYAHIFRGMLYGSYLVAREALWCSGVVILLFMILTAFLGYILPWGQMSLWGATVITNLASTLPKVGEILVFWLWGGFSVANPTLNKFFSLHYIFPFIILVFVIGHLLLLHITGSSNPLGINYNVDKTPFAPYYIVKDTLSIHWFLIFYSVLIFFIPNYLGHPDNYIPANSDVTPEHIVPEWYFLSFYAILRSIPDKSLGVVALLLSIIFLLCLPVFHRSFLRSSFMKPFYRILLLVFFAIAVLLGYIGSKPIEYPFLIIGQILTFSYFAFFFFLTIVDRIDFNLLKYFVLQKKKYFVLPKNLTGIGVTGGGGNIKIKGLFVFSLLSFLLAYFSVYSVLRFYTYFSIIVSGIFFIISYLFTNTWNLSILNFLKRLKDNKFLLNIAGMAVFISRCYNNLPLSIAKKCAHGITAIALAYTTTRIFIGFGLIALENYPWYAVVVVLLYSVALVNSFIRSAIILGSRYDMLNSSLVLTGGLEEVVQNINKTESGMKISGSQLPPPPPGGPKPHVDYLKRTAAGAVIGGFVLALYAAYVAYKNRESSKIDSEEIHKTRVAQERNAEETHLARLAQEAQTKAAQEHVELKKAAFEHAKRVQAVSDENATKLADAALLKEQNKAKVLELKEQKLYIRSEEMKALATENPMQGPKQAFKSKAEQLSEWKENAKKLGEDIFDSF